MLGRMGFEEPPSTAKGKRQSMRRYVMQGSYTQAKSSYSRRITGTRQRSRIRIRGTDNDRTVLPGIDLLSASHRVRLAPILLKECALLGLIPHYKLGRLLRFDPDVLDAWVAENGIEDLWPNREEGS
jgi:hypothetical protein